MSRLVARILLTILMFPLASLVYIVWFAASIDRLRRLGIYNWPREYTISGLVTWSFVAVYWIALWRTSTQWTSRRRLWTMLAALVAIIGGVVAAAVLGTVMYRDVAAFVGSVLAPLLWLTATVFIWRETQAERAARLSHLGSDALMCPACGYNLTGLREARCPECGAQYTLNELVANQPARAAAELERV